MLRFKAKANMKCSCVDNDSQVGTQIVNSMCRIREKSLNLSCKRFKGRMSVTKMLIHLFLVYRFKSFRYTFMLIFYIKHTCIVCHRDCPHQYI